MIRRLGDGPISMKGVYLLYYFGTALYITFVSLYLRSIHLSGAQIGLLVSVVPLASIAIQPLWGILSDRHRHRKLILTLSFLSAALIAPLVATTHSLPLLFLLVAALAVALSPAIPLSDATTLEWLQSHGGSYGSVRIYGSLGFLLGSLFAGRVLSGSHISLLFPLYGLCLGATFFAALGAPPQHSATRDADGQAHDWAVFRRPIVGLFLLLVALGFATSAAYNTFFALYLHDLGASTPIIGVAAALASLSELPVMALSGRVIARFGAKTLLVAGFLGASIRWLLYGLIGDYRVALVFQVLHGLSFAASYVAGVTYMDGIIPTHLRSTGQTVFSGTVFGLAAVVGSILFGALFDHLHAHGMFLAAAAMALLATVGMLVLLPTLRVPAANRSV